MGDYENIHTHIALTQEQGPRVKGTKLQDPTGGAIISAGGGAAESGGAVILWSAQRRTGWVLPEGAEGRGKFSLPGFRARGEDHGRFWIYRLELLF